MLLLSYGIVLVYGIATSWAQDYGHNNSIIFPAFTNFVDAVSHNSYLTTFYYKTIGNRQFIQETNLSDNSAICSEKLANLTESLLSKKYSPLRIESASFFDALGKPPSGILTGNLLFLGSYDSCVQLQSSSNDYYRSCKISATLNISGVPAPFTWTVCFPQECRDGNFTSLKHTLVAMINKEDPKALFVIEESIQTICDNPVPYDVGAYIGIALCSVIIFMAIVGTLWDPIHNVMRSLSASNTLSVQCERTVDDIAPLVLNTVVKDTVETNTFGRVVNCFAIQRTFGALMNTQTKEGQVLCLNGIRVISINWVVLGHIYFLGVSLTDLTRYISVYSRFSFSLIYNALPAVDTFFFISGFLVSFLVLKRVARTGEFNALGYVLHRYLRLTIPYGMVILVHGFLLHIYVIGPFPDMMVQAHEACRKWWWTNLLYINNIVPWSKLQLCVPQSWYLANDFQFFLVAPLFILLLLRKPVLGVLVTCLAIFSSAVAAGVLTTVDNFGPTAFFDPTGANMTDFRLMYDKPWIRIQPYLVGILGGWFYWSFAGRMKIVVARLHLVKRLLLGSLIWITTCSVQFAVVFGLHDDMLKKLRAEAPGHVGSIAYEVCARTSWSVALLIQIMACHAGLGGVINTVLSWSGWLVLSRLTYSVYLLHYILIISLITQLRHPFYLIPDYEVGIIYIGCLVMSYGAGTLLYIFVEQPLAFLDQLILNR